jgi:hypothetical protein
MLASLMNKLIKGYTAAAEERWASNTVKSNLLSFDIMKVSPSEVLVGIHL